MNQNGWAKPWEGLRPETLGVGKASCSPMKELATRPESLLTPHPRKEVHSRAGPERDLRLSAPTWRSTMSQKAYWGRITCPLVTEVEEELCHVKRPQLDP